MDLKHAPDWRQAFLGADGFGDVDPFFAEITLDGEPYLAIFDEQDRRPELVIHELGEGPDFSVWIFRFAAGVDWRAAKRVAERILGDGDLTASDLRCLGFELVS